jgi:hypothetical protein
LLKRLLKVLSARPVATGAVAMGLLGTSVGAGVIVIGTPPPPGGAPADYYIATTGSDSNPGTQGSPFLTMDKCADQAQSSAKTCEMASGTYSVQTVDRSAGTRTALMTFRPVSGGTVTINSIFNGVNGGASEKGQDYISVDGIASSLVIDGTFTCWWNTGGALTNITLTNLTVKDTSDASDLVSCGDTTNFTATNLTVGPSCCTGVGFGMGKSNGTSPGNTNHLYQNLTIFGLWDTCLGVGGADAWPTEYGSCSGYGFGDWVAAGSPADPSEPRHIDGIQLVDCDNCTVDRVSIFRLLGASSQGLFVHANNNGTFANLTVKNVMIAGTRQGSFVFDGDGGAASGTFKLLYSSSAGSGAGFGFGTNSGNRFFAAGTSVIVVGNVGPLLNSETPAGCTITAFGGSTITPTAWANLNSYQTCVSDENGSATFVSTVHPFDLRLQSGSNGVNEGETTYCGSGKDVAVDREGTTRFLGSACDRGADEKE